MKITIFVSCYPPESTPVNTVYIGERTDSFTVQGDKAELIIAQENNTVKVGTQILRKLLNKHFNDDN